jgi:hypothetical protein
MADEICQCIKFWQLWLFFTILASPELRFDIASENISGCKNYVRKSESFDGEKYTIIEETRRQVQTALIGFHEPGTCRVY